MGISKGHSVFFDIENNYKLLAILCHVVYATMGFFDLAATELIRLFYGGISSLCLLCEHPQLTFRVLPFVPKYLRNIAGSHTKVKKDRRYLCGSGFQPRLLL
jgi:hypothetical protein